MRVISTPFVLRVNSIALLLLPVLLAFQALIIESTYRSRHHAWRVMLAVWIIAEISLWVPAAGLLKAKPWSLRVIALLLIAWFLTLVFWVQWNALSISILGALWVIFNFSIQEYKKSYLDSGKKWFSGFPSRIPNVRAKIEGKSAEYWVARIDKNGIFLFSNKKQNTELDEDSLVRLNLYYEDKTVTANTNWISFDPEINGMGLRFAKHNLDESKDLMDFIELLKGKGYIL